jgi:hypothetical protein
MKTQDRIVPVKSLNSTINRWRLYDQLIEKIPSNNPRECRGLKTPHPQPLSEYEVGGKTKSNFSCCHFFSIFFSFPSSYSDDLGVAEGSRVDQGVRLNLKDWIKGL